MSAPRNILKTCGLEKCDETLLPTLQVHFLEPVKRKEFCGSSNLLIDNISSLDSWLSWSGCVPLFDPNNYKKHTGVNAEQFATLKNDVEKEEAKRLGDAAKWFSKPAVFESEKEIIFLEKLVVSGEATVLIVGDIHCSLTSLLNILRDWKKNGWLYDDFSLARNIYVFFLGDVFDRGPYGIELLTLIFTLKLKNRGQVTYINGNHENCETYTSYGMSEEVEKKFANGDQDDETLLTMLLQHMSFLQYQPSAVLLQYKDVMLQLAHGAFTDDQREQLAITQFGKSGKSFLFLRDFSVRCKPLRNNSVDNQKWGDFVGTKEDNAVNKRGKNAGKVYGWLSTKTYLEKVGLVAIISGHQDLSNFTMLCTPLQSKERKEKDPNYKTLYRPAGYDQRPLVHSYQPKIDFIAVNTSTALDSKGNKALAYDCYLVLK